MNNAEVDFHIRHNYTWTKLPNNVKQCLGNSQKEYEKAIVTFSIKNQLRYRGNLVRAVHPVERRYYEEVLAYSQAKLLLYPYHLSDVMVQGLRVTPFQYYLSILENIMEAERSYDSLPNFTAADCLRLLGIGRNEYIELMNQARSGRKLFRRKPARSLLPQSPLSVPIEAWWCVQLGCVTEEDIKMVTSEEKELIDRIIDQGKGQKAGGLDLVVVHSLYKKGLIYLEVPIEDTDHIVVPPLEGFVMNRVLGDYFETLLYKIFVSIDEHTSVGELASVLQIDSDSVKSAVSLYCRLGFARKKGQDMDMSKLHPSWLINLSPPKSEGGRCSEVLHSEPEMILQFNATLVSDPGLPTPCTDLAPPLPGVSTPAGVLPGEEPTFLDPTQQKVKRIAFLFDSTLTAFLMMGNLSPGLKSHAVTMFEVGKLADESLPSLLGELERVRAGAEGEGEAQRYFDHALVLRHTIRALRNNPELGPLNLSLDLVRCESLQSLDPVTCARLLHKNYSLLVSMAPLCKEIRPVSSCSPAHLGPALPEVNSVWFKLFLYHLTGKGPPSLLLVRGTRVRQLPGWLCDKCEKLLVTVWGHDPATLPVSSIMFTLNEALTHSPVLLQAFGMNRGADTMLVPFPFVDNQKGGPQWRDHAVVQSVCSHVDLEHNCGYVTLANLGSSQPSRAVSETSLISFNSEPRNGIQNKECAAILAEELRSLDAEQNLEVPCTHVTDTKDWTLLDVCFGVPLFDAEANQSILQAIVNAELWKEESLEALTQSSRLLCLRLLDFISEYQELPVIPEELVSGTSSGANKKLTSMCVALPTQNLCFRDCKLQKWK